MKKQSFIFIICLLPSVFSWADEIRLDADLKSLFSQVQNLVEQSDKKGAKKLSVPGQIWNQNISHQIKVEVKGNSSLSSDECSFPKLKIKFDKNNLPSAGIFKGMKKVSINTHCGELPSSKPTPKNRIANELSPLREYYVYKILEALEIPVQKTRLARIHYSQMKITRYALLIEDIDVAAAAWGGEVVDTDISAGQSTWVPGDDPALMPKPSFSNALDANVDMSLLARVFLAQALIGNYDWMVKVSSEHESFQSIWNARLVSRVGKKSLIIPEDFDLPTILTGRLDIAENYLPEVIDSGNSVLMNVALGRIKEVEELFRKQVYAKEMNFVSSKKASLLELVKNSALDANGKKNFILHIDEFYKALDQSQSDLKR